jgi:methylase of polypeptide subunit release factors
MSYAAAQTLAEHLKIAANNAPIKVLEIGSGSGVWGIALLQGVQKAGTGWLAQAA